MRLEEMRPAEIQDAAKRKVPVLLPVGVLENHGWHLPCGVDLLVSRGVCEIVEQRIEAVLAPALPYGPGVEAVGSPAMGSLEVMYPQYLPYAQAVLTGLVRMGFHHIFAVCHHQGTGGPQGLSMQLAASHLWLEHPKQHHPNWWGTLPPKEQPAPPGIQVIATSSGRFLDKKYLGGDHGGYWETSMILGLKPERVEQKELDRGEPWFSQREPHPRTCTVEFGRELIQAWASALAEEILIRTGKKTDEEVRKEREAVTKPPRPQKGRNGKRLSRRSRSS